MRKPSLAGVLTAIALIGGLLPASAAPAIAGAPDNTERRPGAVLHFFRGEATITRDTPIAREHVGTLICNPNTGDHSRADEACAAIRTAEGRFEAIPPRDAACTLEYRPVPMEVFGVWDGTPIHYARTFGNPCLVGVEAAGIFDF
ncbi:hypothetical protein HNR23_001430 [Nocardiopsis mwathae]|uniref:Subtilisin inhibitor domain-containing protein n=1 Tax=Nocardiopsis mwathae TaxID=1472723 RepID=A0A7W9YFT6_9ACTN|nr:SSI family serine proteinase inhibitor [Nocardiopsis mwathae]MBB6171370.1 hypothetical protein [Nocardiopsis mwathae]